MRRWMSVLAVAAAFGAVASPAQAVVGLRYVTSASVTDSAAPKSLVIYCPAGTVSIGGGAVRG